MAFNSRLLEFQGALAAVDFIASHKYYLISPTWAVLSQGAGEAMQVQSVCLGLPRDKAMAPALPRHWQPAVGEHTGCQGKDGRVEAHWLQLLGQKGRRSGEGEI